MNQKINADQAPLEKVLYQGKVFPVLREAGDYLVCQLENCELELVVKRSEVQMVMNEAIDEGEGQV